MRELEPSSMAAAVQSRSAAPRRAGTRGRPLRPGVRNSSSSRRTTRWRPCGAKPERELLMWEALREATDEEMERDPTVLVMGEDVGHYGGSYKVTYDLYKKYGE